jgi:hypothetical protein
MKPEIKFENGKLVASVKVGVDVDNDGINSVGADVTIYLDAKEVVTEIIKTEIPSWLKDLLERKSE